MDPVSVAAAALVCTAAYAVAYRRKGRVGSVRVGASHVDIYSPADPAVVFDAIAAIGPPYTVDDLDRDTRMLVLSSRPTFWSYGFLYPINVVAEDGGTRVEIGVTSRLFHIGPGPGIARSRCRDAIARLLTVPPATVRS
jgi:hypothetical protein